MSKFYAISGSESDSSSSDDDMPQKMAGGGGAKFNFSDDEDSTKRVVKSLKDKRYDEMKLVIKNITNYKRIKDMPKIAEAFDDLTKAFDKSKKVIAQEGFPTFYLRAMHELEEFTSQAWEDKELRKSLSKHNAKNLTTLRQKLKKYIRDNLEPNYSEYKKNPDVGEESEEEEQKETAQDQDEEDSDEEKPAPAKPQKKAAAAFDGDSEDSIDWGSSDDDSSSSDDDGDYVNLAAKFLKKPGGGEEKGEKKKPEKVKKVRTTKAAVQEIDGEDEWVSVGSGKAIVQEKQKLFAKDAEITFKDVLEKLNGITSLRGKKSTDRSDQISVLTELRDIAAKNNMGVAMDIKIRFSIMSAIFDSNMSIVNYMKPESWEQCTSSLSELLAILKANPETVVGENIPEDEESIENPPFRIHGSLIVCLERMDDEFTKILQHCDAHSTEYVDRLKDEQKVCALIEETQAYLENSETISSEICRIYFRRIQHQYYKFDGHGSKETAEKNRQLIDQLAKFIYSKDETGMIRTRTLLCHIYHRALHDNWFEARDLMLMSHLQETIQVSDVPTQIMYNRAMVQLGLCAFRQGLIRDAHNCLVDIQSGGRAKELLAQGLLMQRLQERSPEQEKIEKRRQMPYHMHINLELLECVYLISAMLLEIPYMAAHEFDARRRMISKNFHHVLKISDRQPLVGPPESMREHVVAASKAMKAGDWKACNDFIINDKMNAKVWDLFYDGDSVKTMIVQKIQEESLRTYLFTYSNVYNSLNLAILADMFQMEKKNVYSVISKMIINEELMASLDQPTESIVMHRTEPTRLQSLALQLSEKVSTLVEHNEKLMEIKQGGSGFFNQKGRDGQNYQDHQNRSQNRYGGYRDKNRDNNQRSGGGYYQGKKNNRGGGNRYDGGNKRYGDSGGRSYGGYSNRY